MRLTFHFNPFILNSILNYIQNQFNFFIFRCTINRKIDDTSDVVVWFIDFGNMQRVNIRELKIMPFKFMKVPRHSLLVQALKNDIEDDWIQNLELGLKIQQKQPELFFFENDNWNKL